MNAVHVLLIRPWEYDVYATYNGRTNQYIIKVDDLKITLLPLPPKKMQQAEKPNLLVESQKIEKRFKFTECGIGSSNKRKIREEESLYSDSDNKTLRSISRSLLSSLFLPSILVDSKILTPDLIRKRYYIFFSFSQFSLLRVICYIKNSPLFLILTVIHC